MPVELRPYQRRTIDDVWAWFRSNPTGNPCVVLPTGAGKSHIVAELCREAVQRWPSTRILMLTHVKELIEQNAQKMRLHWPLAPLGIYSAGLRRKEVERITFAGIQSVREKAEELGRVNLVVIDECHIVNHKAEGGYRKLLAELREVNPRLRVIGLTATPYRLGHGLIHEGKDTIFSDLIEPVSIEELVSLGFLAPLKSKLTRTELRVDGVKKRGGEFIEKELQAAVNKHGLNAGAVQDILSLAGERRHWLIFCTGVQHAMDVADALRDAGVSACEVTGAMPAKARAEVLRAFRDGEIRAVTNANVLTTGFDFPDIDLIAFLRPTMSPGLYAQMAGRGLRVKSHTDHCLVLDFAGNVQRHGPITGIQAPRRAGEGGEAPVKACPECDEILFLGVVRCPECDYQFPPPEEKAPSLDTQSDIMGDAPQDIPVGWWEWKVHESRTSGKIMARVIYTPSGLSAMGSVSEYLCVLHGGWAGAKANRQLGEMARDCGVDLAALRGSEDDRLALEELCEVMGAAPPPAEIQVKRDGKWWRVLSRRWEEGAAEKAKRQEAELRASLGAEAWMMDL